MATSGYDTDPIPEQPSQATQPEDTEASAGGSYETSSADATCSPNQEEGISSQPGEYNSESSDATCAPEVPEGAVNTSGEYDSEGSGGTVPGETPGHPSDCDCETCCFYTEEIPNTENVGGHEEGGVYNQVPMRDMWYQLLHPYQYPAITLNLLPKILEVGQCLTNVDFNWDTTNEENVLALSTQILSRTGVIATEIISVEQLEMITSLSNVLKYIILSTETIDVDSSIQKRVSGKLNSTEILEVTTALLNSVINMTINSTEKLLVDAIISNIIMPIINSSESLMLNSYVIHVIRAYINSTESVETTANIESRVSGKLDSEETLIVNSLILAGSKYRITSPVTRITSTTVRID